MQKDRIVGCIVAAAAIILLLVLVLPQIPGMNVQNGLSLGSHLKSLVPLPAMNIVYPNDQHYTLNETGYYRIVDSDTGYQIANAAIHVRPLANQNFYEVTVSAPGYVNSSKDFEYLPSYLVEVRLSKSKNS